MGPLLVEMSPTVPGDVALERASAFALSSSDRAVVFFSAEVAGAVDAGASAAVWLARSTGAWTCLRGASITTSVTTARAATEAASPKLDLHFHFQAKRRWPSAGAAATAGVAVSSSGKLRATTSRQSAHVERWARTWLRSWAVRSCSA